MLRSSDHSLPPLCQRCAVACCQASACVRACSVDAPMISIGENKMHHRVEVELARVPQLRAHIRSLAAQIQPSTHIGKGIGIAVTHLDKLAMLCQHMIVPLSSDRCMPRCWSVSLSVAYALISAAWRTSRVVSLLMAQTFC